MNLIKHIANILAIWTMPFIVLLFFILITGFAFTYQEAIHNGGFIILTTIYCVVGLIMYVGFNNDEDMNSMKLFKTN